MRHGDGNCAPSVSASPSVYCLGEQVANELVEWFNAVDLTYRTDLRETNELNFSRFSAEMSVRFAEQDTKWEKRFAEMDAKWEKRFAEMEARMERRFADLEVRIERRFTEQTRFLYVSLVAQLALIAGLYLR